LHSIPGIKTFLFILAISSAFAQTAVPLRDTGDRLMMGYVYYTPVLFKPMLSNTEYEDEINELIFGDGLFTVDASGQPRNALALSSRNEDARIWTVTLQPNLYFQDGSSLTTEDVQFSFELYRKFALQAPKLFMVRYINRVEIVNAYTIRIILDRPVENFRNTIGVLPIIPRRYYKGWLDYDSVYKLPFIKPIGTGPFLFRQQLLNRGIQLRANPYYTDNKPYLEGIDIKFYDTYDGLLTAFLQEEIDIIQVDDKNVYRKINQIIDLVNITRAKRDDLKLYYIILNTGKDPFNDLDIRKAVNHAINKNLLVERNLPLKAYSASNILDINSEYYFKDVPDYKYDPLYSLEILEEAGFSKRGNGKLFNNNRELKFQFFFEKGSSFQESLARLISINMGELGINVTPRPLKPAEIEKRVREGDYQAALRHFTYYPRNSEQVLREFYLDGLNNINGYRNFTVSSIDNLVKRSELTVRINELVPQMQRIQYLINRYVPCVYLFFEYRIYYAIHERFENTKLGVRENLRYQVKLTPKYEWYVPQNKQKY